MRVHPLLSATSLRLPAVVICTVIAFQSSIAVGQNTPDGRSPGVVQLMNQVEALQAELNKLRGQLEVMTNGLENAQKRQRDMYLDLDTRLRRIEQTSSEAGAKDGAVGDLDTRLKRLEQAAGSDRDAIVSDFEARLKRLESQIGTAGERAAPITAAPATPAPATTAPAATTATPAPPTAPIKPTPPAPPTGASEVSVVRKAYDAGLAAYKAGDYQGAIASFDGIVKRYPRDPLAANAQYWIGDAWFNLRDYKSAAAAQNALIANYPDSAKVPDAMLNLGSAYAALGDPATARKTLDDLITRYPQSEAAQKARARLGRPTKP